MTDNRIFKKILLCLIAVCAFCLPVLTIAQESINLIINGDMEKVESGKILPDGWEKITFPNLETICSIKTADVGHNGGKSIETTWISGMTRFGVCPTLRKDIQGRGKFEFSAYCRTGMEGKGYLAMAGFDEKGDLIQSTASSDSIRNRQDWRKLSWMFYTYPEVKSVKVYCLNGGKGKVWFDDVSLRQLPMEKRKRIRLPIHASCEPVDGNRFWQGGKRIFNTIIGSPCPLSFVFHGQAREFKNPKLVVKVPLEMNIQEFDFTWGGNMSKPGSYQRLMATKQEITREKQLYISYSISLPEVWDNTETVLLGETGPKITCYFEGSDRITDEDYTVFWHLENDGIKSREWQFTLRFLPLMEKTQNPKRFIGANFRSFDLNMEDLSLLDRVLSKYKEAGMAEKMIFQENTENVNKRMLERGWKVGAFISTDMYHFYSGWMSAELQEKVRWAVNADGVAESGKNATPCPTFALNSPEFRAGYKESIIRPIVNKVRDGAPIMLDFEPFGIPSKRCFCGECIKEFSKRYKIAMEKLTNPQEILTNYWREWGCYWSYLFGRATGELCAIIRETHPHSPIIMYGYIRDYEKREIERILFQCPLDLRILDEHVDVHLLLINNLNKNDLLDKLDMVSKMLKKPVIVNPRVSRAVGATGAYTNVDHETPPALLRIKLIASAATSAEGFNIYPGIFYDGMFFKEIDRAMQEIALLENFYMRGKRCDKNFTVSNDSEKILEQYIGLRAHKLGNRFLITLFNFHKTFDAYVSLSATSSIRGKRFAVWDPIRKVIVKSGRGNLKWSRAELKEGLKYKIPMTDARFVIIGPYRERPKGRKEVKIDFELRELERVRSMSLREGSRLKPIIRGNTRIMEGEDIDQDGRPEIVMETNKQKLWVSPGAEAHIVQWIDKRDNSFVCERGSRKGMAVDMCWDLRWWPEDYRPKGESAQECDKIETDIKGTLPVMKASFKRRIDEILVEKTYALGDEYLDVQYAIRNMSDEEQEFSFWSHNCPTLGLKGDFRKKSSVIVATPDGIIPIPDDHEGKYREAFYEVIGVKGLGIRDGSITGKVSSGTFALYIPELKKALRVEVEFEKLLQIYTWGSPSVRTIEWMYRNVTLEPGEEWKTEFRLTSLLDIETARDAVGAE